MDELMLAELCHRYALGQPMNCLKPVSGGFLHHMYCLQTTQGRFAVKVLNPAIMQYANVRQNFRLSERVAAAVAAASLPAVPALQSVGEVIHDLGQESVMVFPWIDSRASSAAPATQAQQIGGILGRIHALPLCVKGIPVPGLSDLPKDEAAGWALLVKEAEQKNIAWAGEVRQLLPQIAS